MNITGESAHNPSLSILLFSFNSSCRLESSVSKIINFFEKEKISFELLIIDDGSQDNSFEIAERLEIKDNRIKAYQLSRNYTTPYAQFAGLSRCRGNCAVFVPDDLQRPLTVVLKMYRLWESGHKLVIPYRKSRSDSLVGDYCSNLYYRIMNTLSEVTFPPGGADGFLADREIIDILNEKINPINTTTMVEVLRLGFDPFFFPYDRPATEGKSRWTFAKKYKLAKDTFFSSSSFPIKLIFYMGLGSFIFSLCLIAITVYAKLFGDFSVKFGFSVPGWASTVIFVSLFSGLVLFSLGIIAEYIWRILEEVKNRPGYIIKEKDGK